MIIACTSMSGNNTRKTSYISTHEFSVSKACKVNIKPPRAPLIKEVIWSPPSRPWIKINTDDASVKNLVKAAVGGIFRNEDGMCLDCFAQFLGDGNAIFAELSL